MSKVNDVRINNEAYNIQKAETTCDKNIELTDISILYSTDKVEDERADFDSSFEKAPIENEEDGASFLNGLIENKDVIQERLGLTDAQYDSLACIALGLASQETGMGKEAGYTSENEGFGKYTRQFAKWVDVHIFDGASASSGLTQMKIYDFLNGGLNQEYKDLLSDLGVTADGVATNNLYDNPDKAAVATMVVLKSLVDTYPQYKNVLAEEHTRIGSEFNDGLSEEERIAIGEKFLADISSIYEKESNLGKEAIRGNFKEWLLAENNSKLGDKNVDEHYNEELQLGELNDALNGEIELNSDSLNYIRYALTSSGKEMDVTQFCAYAWNKGTGTSGMKLDRLLADKVGIILASPENFDYDQFTVNVNTLAQKYADQSNSNYKINSAFDENLYG